MREAVIDAKVGVRDVREAVARTDAELVAERQRLADTERRGRLAGEIQDQETVVVAERFAVKHRERAQQVGIVLLMALMVYAFYNDIARFFEKQVGG